jgi:hypothetical protein
VKPEPAISALIEKARADSPAPVAEAPALTRHRPREGATARAERAPGPRPELPTPMPVEECLPSRGGPRKRRYTRHTGP